MSVWGFIVGMILGIGPIMGMLRLAWPRFISNLYIKGAVFGMALWALINMLVFLEARYSLFGLLKGESAFSSMMILASSLQGFITAGILAAFLTNLLKKYKK